MLYLLFRNDVIFLDLLGLNYYEPIRPGNSPFANFVLYNLSDALWAMAVLFYVSSQDCIAVRVIGLLMPATMEVCQLHGAVPGTFDYVDLVIYILISLIFYNIWKRKAEI